VAQMEVGMTASVALVLGMTATVALVLNHFPFFPAEEMVKKGFCV